MKVYRDKDCDLSLVRSRRVTIIGYGNQGRAQALNLRDSGVSVTVALRDGSAARPHAERDGFPIVTAAEAAREADLVVMLAADEDHGRIYAEEIAPNLRIGAALSFAHGLSIRFGLIERTDCKANMDDDIIIELRVRHIGQIDLFDDAAKADLANPHNRVIFACDTQYPAWNR